MGPHPKPVLVTGGAGYIGSHTCKALAKAGYLPITLDNLVYGHSWAVKWGPLEIGDVGDAQKVEELLRRYSPCAVIHFAGYTYVGESVQNPSKYYQNNFLGTFNLLDTLRKHASLPFIFSSTCAIYGLPSRIPIDENHPQNPVNPYGFSKYAAERLIGDFSKAYGFPFAALRYFNACGADPEGELGELHDPETHLIPLAIDTAMGRYPHLNIYGTDYPTPDGTAIRDYIHVADLADAHVKALEHLLKGGENLSVNVGTGTGYSVRQVVAAVEAIAGPVPVIETARRPGDPPVLVADTKLCESLLQWKPLYASLEKMIETAWSWHQRKRF